MSRSPGLAWESAFVAVAAVLGEPLDAITAALSESGGACDASARDLIHTLRSATREQRARALARALSEVALALDRSGSA